jgi:hypothetical protein
MKASRDAGGLITHQDRPHWLRKILKQMPLSIVSFQIVFLKHQRGLKLFKKKLLLILILSNRSYRKLSQVTLKAFLKTK